MFTTQHCAPTDHETCSLSKQVVPHTIPTHYPIRRYPAYHHMHVPHMHIHVHVHVPTGRPQSVRPGRPCMYIPQSQPSQITSLIDAHAEWFKGVVRATGTT